jgi:hypothetical protein
MFTLILFGSVVLLIAIAIASLLMTSHARRGGRRLSTYDLPMARNNTSPVREGRYHWMRLKV